MNRQRDSFNPVGWTTFYMNWLSPVVNILLILFSYITYSMGELDLWFGILFFFHRVGWQGGGQRRIAAMGGRLGWWWCEWRLLPAVEEGARELCREKIACPIPGTYRTIWIIISASNSFSHFHWTMFLDLCRMLLLVATFTIPIDSYVSNFMWNQDVCQTLVSSTSWCEWSTVVTLVGQHVELPGERSYVYL